MDVVGYAIAIGVRGVQDAIEHAGVETIYRGKFNYHPNPASGDSSFMEKFFLCRCLTHQ